MREPNSELMFELCDMTDDFSVTTDGMLVMVSGQSELPDELAEAVKDYGWSRDESCSFDSHYYAKEDNTAYAFAPAESETAEIRGNQRAKGTNTFA